jgi:hypothetical protein
MPDTRSDGEILREILTIVEGLAGSKQRESLTVKIDLSAIRDGQVTVMEYIWYRGISRVQGLLDLLYDDHLQHARAAISQYDYGKTWHLVFRQSGAPIRKVPDQVAEYLDTRFLSDVGFGPGTELKLELKAIPQP